MWSMWSVQFTIVPTLLYWHSKDNILNAINDLGWYPKGAQRNLSSTWIPINDIKQLCWHRLYVRFGYFNKANAPLHFKTCSQFATISGQAPENRNWEWFLKGNTFLKWRQFENAYELWIFSKKVYKFPKSWRELDFQNCFRCSCDYNYKDILSFENA